MTSPIRYRYNGVETDLPAFWYARGLTGTSETTQIDARGIVTNRWDALRRENTVAVGLRHAGGYIEIDAERGGVVSGGIGGGLEPAQPGQFVSFAPGSADGDIFYRRRHLFDAESGVCASWYTELRMGNVGVAVLHVGACSSPLFATSYDTDRGLEQYVSFAATCGAYCVQGAMTRSAENETERETSCCR